MIYLPLPISPLTVTSRFQPREGEATQQRFIRGQEPDGEAPPRGLTLHPFQLYRPFLKEKVPLSYTSSIGYL